MLRRTLRFPSLTTASLRFCSTNETLATSSPFVPPPSEPLAVKIPLATLTDVPRRALCLTGRWKPENIRNFCIVAHVDHGKTTLSDAILRRGGALDDSRAVGTFMDKLQVEQERGITVKSQCCTFFIRNPLLSSSSTTKTSSSSSSDDNNTIINPDELIMMNLVDTPGHVDFSFEVARCLRATEGAVLLVDAGQGVQAQTVANAYLAIGSDNVLIPALSKLDAVMSEESIITSLSELESTTGLTSSDVVMTAARSKRGIETLLTEIVKKVPPPRNADPAAQFRGLIIDSWIERTKAEEDPYKKASNNNNHSGSNSNNSINERLVILVRLREGTVRRRDVVALLNMGKRYTVNEVGFLYPDPVPVGELVAGQVGYLALTEIPLTAQQIHQAAAAARSAATTPSPSIGAGAALTTPQQQQQQSAKALTGDTVYALVSYSRESVAATRNFAERSVEAVCEFKPLRPVVFASFFPDEGEAFETLAIAVEQLRLNDPTVSVSETTCPAFGRGMQLGFLGMLHLSVFQQRLESEFAITVLVTPAQVFYKYVDKHGATHDLTAGTFVNLHEGAVSYLEPIVTATIVTPAEYQGAVVSLATSEYRGELLDTALMEEGKRVTLRLKMPLADMTRGWFDALKSLSHGFAALEYDEPTFEPADLVKLEVVVNKARISALSTICQRDQAQRLGQHIVAALKDNLQKAIIDTPIQAMLGSKCIASAKLSAKRKDVTDPQKMYGGDKTRKMKKLQHQKEGKAKIAKRMVGQVSIDTETLLAVMGATRVGGN